LGTALVLGKKGKRVMLPLLLPVLAGLLGEEALAVGVSN
jgi:hypothetical protein